MQIQNSPVVTNNLGLAKVNLQRQKGARSLLAPGEDEDIFTPPTIRDQPNAKTVGGSRVMSKAISRSNQPKQSAEAISRSNQP